MRGAIPLLPQYAFMAWCLVKHRDNFTFYLATLLGLLKKIVTGYKIWIFKYDPKEKHQSLQVKGSEYARPRRQNIKIKLLYSSLISFIFR
jgi:hypothetical protein